MARRKRINPKDATIIELSNALVLNGQAQREGPKFKKWTKHDLKQIKPLTPTQNTMFHDFFQGQNIVAYGTAGTGKSYVRLYLAFSELLRPESPFKHIILVRSAVPTRDLGFMPGTLEEKIRLYELPYVNIVTDLFGRHSTYYDMKDVQPSLLHFSTTSYVRSLTWDNAIIIADECQNMTFHEINSVMTRLGENSRIIFAGDAIQTDINKKGEQSGIQRLISVRSKMKEFSVVQFTKYDIVRSKIVKSWIEATEEC